MTAVAELEQQERTYTSTEVVELTGTTYRRIDHYCRLGWLPETAHGSGSSREFTMREVEIVRTAMQLQAAGFAPEPSVRVATLIVDDGPYVAKVGDIFQLRIAITVEPNPAGGDS